MNMPARPSSSAWTAWRIASTSPAGIRQLRARLVASGELLVRQSRGRHPNVYRIPYERCPTCPGGHPKLELPVESHPKPLPLQPETAIPPIRNSGPVTPKLQTPQPETDPPPTRNWEGGPGHVRRGSSDRKK
jgi:hypothetical protein